MEYRYSATQNNGQITQQASSGEEVTYTYDSLNRLITAVTTGPEWGQSFTYDGFGNRTGVSVIKGSVPSSSFYVDPATNRLGGFGYDANGNMTTAPGVSGTLAYDVENRLTSAGGDSYAYGPGNKRIWKKKPDGSEELYFYGISGQKLGTYHLGIYTNAPLRIEILDVNVYFASRTIISRGVTPLLDRLGSNRAGGSKYFPYGEEQQVTAQDRDKFATYYRDASGLDYAQNRYYANTLGRFLTPDPFKASAGPADSGSWNRYAYVENDPINYWDPRGKDRFFVGDIEVDCPDDENGPQPCHFHRFPSSPGVRRPTEPDREIFTPIKVDPNGLESAVAKAITALRNKVTCRDLFNGDAINLLLNLLGGSDQGILVFENLGAPSGGSVEAARTTGILGRNAQGQSVFTGVTVKINNNLDAPWYGGYPDIFGIGNSTSTATQNIYRAITTLHELGHAAAIITGWGGSDIKDDGKDRDPSGALSRANTKLIYDNCFRP